MVPDGQFSGLDTKPFERGNPLSGGCFQTFVQHSGIVGDELGAVSGTADLDIEALLDGEMAVNRFHQGDHVVHSATWAWKAWTVQAQAWSR